MFLRLSKGVNPAAKRYGTNWIRAMANSPEKKENLYVLPMFPYPSGKAHMGHVRVCVCSVLALMCSYSISDCITRYKRMCGYNAGVWFATNAQVIQPMGWDAFGLPAENAAMERGIPPAEWTEKNIREMRKQIDGLNCLFNWEDEINTSKPEYYKWTQWMFLKLWEKGYVSRKSGLVNWDPVDHTVLANEQVDQEGRSWRSGAIVEKRVLDQWYILTTKMSDSLLKGLDSLPNWPSLVKTAQQRWIGKSDGCRVEFQIAGQNKTIPVFTTHVETIMGVSFIGLAATHPVTLSFTSQDANLREFLNHVSKCPYKVGEGGVAGYRLPLQVVHPITHALLPVYVCNYVLADYGDGAVMGVPSHDARDGAFASLLHLPATRVVEGKTLVNSGEFSGLDVATAVCAIAAKAQSEHWGKPATQLRLRDWLVSRQRYWGAPIPAIHCPHCGIVPVPYADLPVELPPMTKDSVGKMAGDEAMSPLGRYQEWKRVKCPHCGCDHAERDCDTLDTFMDSSWYFYRYLDPHNASAFCSADRLNAYPRVNYYIGGAEHSIMHLLFSRFLAHFLYEQHLVPQPEPFDHLLTQGMVLGATYLDKETGAFLHPEDVERSGAKLVEKATGKEVVEKYLKMSKSKYNGIDPVEVLKQYGSDVVRVAMLMQCPPSNSFLYNKHCMAAAQDVVAKIDRICAICKEGKNEGGKPLDTNKFNSQFNKVLHDMNQFDFHNVISGLNIMMNLLADAAFSKHYVDHVKQVLLFWEPFAPQKSAACWRELQAARCIGAQEAFEQQRWPTAVRSTNTTVIVQRRRRGWATRS
ncbi:hypothetical protein BLSTO_00559 [Blastocystis sp. subtype 1]